MVLYCFIHGAMLRTEQGAPLHNSRTDRSREHPAAVNGVQFWCWSALDYCSRNLSAEQIPRHEGSYLNILRYLPRGNMPTVMNR